MTHMDEITHLEEEEDTRVIVSFESIPGSIWNVLVEFDWFTAGGVVDPWAKRGKLSAFQYLKNRYGKWRAK